MNIKFAEMCSELGSGDSRRSASGREKSIVSYGEILEEKQAVKTFATAR